MGVQYLENGDFRIEAGTVVTSGCYFDQYPPFGYSLVVNGVMQAGVGMGAFSPSSQAVQPQLTVGNPEWLGHIDPALLLGGDNTFNFTILYWDSIPNTEQDIFDGEGNGIGTIWTQIGGTDIAYPISLIVNIPPLQEWPVVPRSSDVALRIPNPAQLLLAEVAFNAADGVLYGKKVSGAVVPLVFSGTLPAGVITDATVEGRSILMAANAGAIRGALGVETLTEVAMRTSVPVDAAQAAAAMARRAVAISF